MQPSHSVVSNWSPQY